MLELILSQVLVCCINMYIAFTPKKKNVYIATFLFNACNLIMYIFNKDILAVLTYLSITIRSFVYCYKDRIKTNVVPVLCILVQVLICTLSFETIWHIVPMVAASWTCYYMWFFKNTQLLRIGNIVNNSLWLIYNIHSGLWIASLSRIFTVVVNTYSYRRYSKSVLDIQEDI